MSEPSSTSGSATLHVGDCREVLPRLGRSYDLCFADPPFGLGQSYKDFSDRFTDAEYEQFTREWVAVLWAHTQGVMCLHGPDKLATLFVDLEKELGFRDHRVAWLNWHYRFGQCSRRTWIDSRCHCLVYAKDPDNFTWNPEAVLVDSDRKAVYRDKRIHDYERGGQRLPFTTWGVPSDGPGFGRVQGNNRERWKNHPNQLPIAYLRRLVLAYTNPGAIICDAFLGSGTTGLVATREGRNFVGVDVSAASVESARERLANGYYPERR